MKNEEWRDVVGYEGLYQVSSEGRVKSLERTFIDKSGRKRTVKERILKPGMDKGGYLRIDLCASGKSRMFSVHRLVCQAFHDNPENKLDVNHINENKTDNRACNLEWSTRKKNCNHGTRNVRMAETKSKQVGQYTLNGELIKVWSSATEAERRAGFDHSAISKVANGKRKTAYGFRWKHIERKEKITNENN